MSLKSFARTTVRLVWRKLVRPILQRLPPTWRARLLTLAHYSKITLVHGEVIDFSALQPSPSSSSPMPSSSRRTAPTPVLPDWVCSELAELAQIEPEFTPTPAFLKQFHVYRPPMALDAAAVYARCRGAVDALQPDMIILVPWLVKGGADLGALRHAEAAVQSGRRVLFIATENAESPWADRVPTEAGLLEFGKLSHALSQEHRMAVFARIALDAPARTLHVINSRSGWELIRQHGRSLTSLGKQIYASVFSDGRDEQGIMWSYPRFYFVDCWPHLSGVLCDSRWYPRELVRQYGVPTRKLHTVYFPQPAGPAPCYRSSDLAPVLWASRITESKRPDLLVDIARRMPDVQFEVFGYATQAERHFEDALRAVPNIRLRGAYDSLGEIVAAEPYSVFLYTSSWDGLPNVLLEATAAGLPVVASAICGVPEFITPETGYPVSESDEAAAYVERLREALSSAPARATRWRAAADLLQSQHSMTRFLGSLRAIPGYLS